MLNASLFSSFLKHVQFSFCLGYTTISIIGLNIVRFLPHYIFQRIFYFLICGFNACMNNKVSTYGNLENIKQQNCIYICNHYDGLDFSLIVELITCPGFNTTYTISKSDLVLPLKYGKFADIINTSFMNASNLIPYNKGNKESGINVLQNVKDKFNTNKHINILLFPEGESRKNGISVKFKPGIFKFAEQHNIPIIPITIYYKSFIGVNKGEFPKLLSWFNNEVKVFIHDKILPQDYNIMLKQSFDLISSTHSKIREMN